MTEIAITSPQKPFVIIRAYGGGEFLYGHIGSGEVYPAKTATLATIVRRGDDHYKKIWNALERMLDPNEYTLTDVSYTNILR